MVGVGLVFVLRASSHDFTGRGTGIVIATGTATEFGVIFSMMQDVRFLISRMKEME